LNDTKPTRLYTAAELIAAPIPETNFYLEPYIPTEGVVLLFGKTSTYKTTLIYSMAQAISVGAPLWDLEVSKAAPILVLELDSTFKAVKTRFAGALTVESEIDTYFARGSVDFVGRSSQYDQDIIAELGAAHHTRQYKLVFVDTLRRVHAMKDVDSDTPSLVYSAVERLFPGAVIVFIHHERKTGKEDTQEMRDESYSGSAQWAAQAQVGIKVSLTGPNRLALKIIKSQVSEIPEAALRLEVTGHEVRREGAVKLDRVAGIMTNLPAGISKARIDALIAVAMTCSLRTAQTRRLEWEKAQPREHTQVAPFPRCVPEVVGH
jgi:hypothetical protein